VLTPISGIRIERELAMLAPVYSKHARLRMRQRVIAEVEVEDVLENYHTSYPDKDGNSILIGHPHGRRIKVVVAKDSNPPFIITVAD
jgi:hypothetical protein